MFAALISLKRASAGRFLLPGAHECVSELARCLP